MGFRSRDSLCLPTALAVAILCAPRGVGAEAADPWPVEGPELEVTDYTENTVESENLTRVVEFLTAGRYLGWEHDPYVRPTGDAHRTLDGDLIDGTTHHRVRIYYSPAVADWLRGGRRGELPDRSMIVKEMYLTVAPFYPQPDPVIGWAAMVKKTGASHAGWYWTIYFKPEYQSMATMAQFSYSFCLTCHASAESENTFAYIDNLTGENAANTTGRSYLDVADPLFFQNVESMSGMDMASTPTWDPAFEHLYSQSAIYPYTTVPEYDHQQVEQAFPQTSYDHVWNPSGLPEDARSYITSDNCVGCHDATLLVDTQVPAMLVRRQRLDPSTARQETELLNLSVYGEWSASPMGMAGRDPIFFSQLETELNLHPEHADLIQNKCLSCHGAMGQRQFHADKMGDYFRLPDVFETDGKRAKYGALARDGISCLICHQMAPSTFPPPGSDRPLPNTGDFKQGAWDTVYGPTAPEQDPGGPIRPVPMQNALGVTPTYDDYLTRSELCGTCHTIVLPVFEGNEKFRAEEPVTDDGEVLLSEAHEQDTYLEWLYSSFATSNPNAGPTSDAVTAATCQDCHMRSTVMENDEPMATRLANVQDTSWPLQPANNLAPAEDITVPVRPDFKRHTFFGMNLFVLSMYRQFGGSVFGLTPDSNPPMGTTSAYDFAIENGTWQIRNETATVEIEDVELAGRGYGGSPTELVTTVRVTNLAGHRLPSGVGFRRAWIEFQVLGADNQVLWASGSTSSQGVIAGPDGKALPSEFTGDWQELQPHWREIREPSQVQIYEERYINRYTDQSDPTDPHPELRLSTSFLGIGKVVKDNRLQPRGYEYDYLSRMREEAKPGSTEWEKFDSLLPESSFDPLPPGAEDPNRDPLYTNGSGADEVTYRIALNAIPGASRVLARLNYQNIPPYYLRDRFAYGRGAQTQRLYYLAGHLETDMGPIEDWKIRIAEATAAVPLEAPGSAGQSSSTASTRSIRCCAPSAVPR